MGREVDSMSEKVLAESIQSELLRLTSLFSEGDVVINDWSILDGSSERAPYVNIETSDDVNLVDIQSDRRVTWLIPLTITVRFTDWDGSLIALRDCRQTVIEHLLQTEEFLEANGKLAWGLRGLRNEGRVAGVYDKYPENEAEALPVFVSQKLICTVEEIV